MRNGRMLSVYDRYTVQIHWLAIFCAMAVCSVTRGQSRLPGTDVDGQREPNGAMEQPLVRSFREEMRQSMRDRARTVRLGYEQRMQGLASLSSVSLEQFDAAWKISLDIDHQPARTVLEGLLSEMGLKLPDHSEFDDLLKTEVSLKLKDGSRLQAIENVCGQLKLYPEYTFERVEGAIDLGQMLRVMQTATDRDQTPDDPRPANPGLRTIRLRAGNRPFPLVFTGPFAVEILQLNEFPPYGSGHLEIRVLAGGIPSSASAYWENGAWSGLAVRQAVDHRGNELRAVGGGTVPWPRQYGLPTRDAYVELKRLLRDVRSVRLLGHVCAPVPVSVETVRLDDLAAGQVKSGTKIRVRVNTIQPQTTNITVGESAITEESYMLSFTVVGDMDIPVEVIALDGAGRPMVVDSGTFADLYYRVSGPRNQGHDHRDSETRNRSIHCSGEPKSLIVKAFVAVERIEYPFEAVADSRSYAEQPLEPVTLQFSGTAPLQISALKLSFDVPFRSVQLRLTNQSNLDIRNATCRLEYLNTAGEALGNHSIWLTSPNYQSTAMSLLVNKGATTEREETAFHAPDGTASVTATPTRIVFADGTSWPPSADNK